VVEKALGVLSVMVSEPPLSICRPEAAWRLFAVALTLLATTIVPLPDGMQATCAFVGTAFASQLPGVCHWPPAGPV
jgi:hypothetical protein